MKKYQIIYADPPWEIKKIKRKVRPNQIEMDYPTMSLDEIKKLDINGISEDNSVCFLWTIQRYLPFAFDVLKEWGFKYQRTITWDKQAVIGLDQDCGETDRISKAISDEIHKRLGLTGGG